MTPVDSTGPAGGHDAFEAVRDLLAIVARPEASKALLDTLAARQAAVAQREAKLAADRAAFNAEMDSKRAAFEAEREQAKADNAKVANWLQEEKRALELKDGKVREIFEALGVRDIPSSISVDGSSMSRANPDYLSAVDQILMALGKPIPSKEPEADNDPNSPKNFVRPEHWRGNLIEPKPSRVKRLPDPHFEA